MNGDGAPVGFIVVSFRNHKFQIVDFHVHDTIESARTSAQWFADRDHKASICEVSVAESPVKST